MNIAVAGTGYVGLSLVTLLSQHNTAQSCDGGGYYSGKGGYGEPSEVAHSG